MKLESKRVTETIDKLVLRIEDRFPESGLHTTCEQLAAKARETEQIIELISTPHKVLRAASIVMILLFLAALLAMILNARQLSDWSLMDTIQTLDSGASLLIFIGLSIWFLWTLEQKYKRAKVLRALNYLRELCHVIDMKQLTKDPDTIERHAEATAHSPKRTLSRGELGRYLDYCSELFDLISKVAYLYAANLNDPVAANAANELQDLASNLSRKVWQKIIVLRSRG